MRALLWLLPTLLLGCGSQDPDSAKPELPPLPPIELREVLPELQALVAAAPQPPGACCCLPAALPPIKLQSLLPATPPARSPRSPSWL